MTDPLTTKPRSDHSDLSHFCRLLGCSPKNPTGLIGGSEIFSSPPTTSCDLASVDSYGSEVLSWVVQPWLRNRFSAILRWPSWIRPIHHVSEGCTSGSSCCAANATRVCVGHPRQAPTSLPVVPFIGPMSPPGSEDDCSFASAQPAVGFYPAHPLVSVSAASILESAGPMGSSTPGHHTPKHQHSPPLWTPVPILKAGQVPEPAMALPHAN